MGQKRYQRQIGLHGWDQHSQSLLGKATVFVAGLGGLGSPVALYLAAAGVGCLRICDNDRVEASNLNRQVLYTEQDIGRTKTDCARDKIARLNGRVRLETLPEKIKPERMKDLVGDAGIIVDCLDNLNARMVLNRFAVENRLPLVHAGVNGWSGQLSFILPPLTPCLNCLYEGVDEPGKEPVLGAAAGILGSLQAMEVIKFITGTGELLLNRLLIMDGESMSFHETTIQKKPDCRVCG